jgi:regulator of protease activity HflC (stomatin/prohibitin superfamily)
MAAAKQLVQLAKWSIGLGVSGWALQESLFDVDGGERAVMFDRFRGVLPNVYGEGTHFRVPILQYPIIFDIRTRPRMISTMTGTKDMQMVNITLRVLSRPVAEQLPTIYKELGEDFDYR